MSELAPPATSATSAVPPAPPAHVPESRVPGWAAWLLRLLVLLTAIFVFLQPVYAGMFVTGEVGLLAIHSAGAFFIVVIVLFQILAAILVWRPGRGPAWPIWASVAFQVVIWVQMTLGYTKLRGAHIPLGALLFGFALLMVVGTWSPRLRVRRSLPRSARGSA